MSSWSYGQKAALAIIPKVSSVLSLLGSSWIIIEVWTDTTEHRRKREHPYHRLLFAMSIYDSLESVWNFMSTWAIPKGTPGVVWAAGTTTSCSAQGFFLTLSVAVPIYNAMLSLYYVLVIKYQCTDATLRRRVEPCMHAIAGLWAFGTALYSASTGLLNNANLWCWIAPLPQGCKDSWRYGVDGNCVRGDNWWIYRWAFYFAPLWFCILMATVCTVMVYRYVRKLDKQTLKYRRPERMSFLNTVVVYDKDNGSSVKNKETGGLSVSFKLPDPGDENSNEDNKMSDEDESKVEDGVLQINVFHRDTANDEPARSKSQSPSREVSHHATLSTPQKDDHRNKDNSDDDTVGDLPSAFLHRTSARRPSAQLENSGKSMLQLISKWKSSRSQYRDDYKRTLEVFHQACFYLGVFYLTHVWSTTNRVIQMISNGDTYYGVIVMHSFFDPLQGFLNYFVYQRPRYLQIRRSYPEVGRLRAISRMLRFSCQPEPEAWKEEHLQYKQNRAASDMSSGAHPTVGSMTGLSSVHGTTRSPIGLPSHIVTTGSKYEGSESQWDESCRTHDDLQ